MAEGVVKDRGMARPSKRAALKPDRDRLESPASRKRKESQSEPKAKVAVLIRDLIRLERLTQVAAAERLGLQQPDVSRLVRGDLRGFSFERLLDLAQALGADVRINVGAGSAFEGAAFANYRNAWQALKLIRETIETLGPPGALPSEEAVVALYGPEPIHEGQAISDALIKILSGTTDTDEHSPLSGP
jgi:predicted XRE-type DNA-binding protein